MFWPSGGALRREGFTQSDEETWKQSKKKKNDGSVSKSYIFIMRKRSRSLTVEEGDSQV